MTLTALGVTWILVAIVFVAAGAATAGWGTRDPGPAVRSPATSGPTPGPRTPGPGILHRVWPGATFEALILTLIAALWFDSLGHGGWVVLFLLLGALPAGDRWVRRLAGGPSGGETGYFVASLLKYLLGGLVCFWLLS